MRPFEIAKGFCLAVNLEAATLEAKKKKTEYIIEYAFQFHQVYVLVQLDYKWKKE